MLISCLIFVHVVCGGYQVCLSFTCIKLKNLKLLQAIFAAVVMANFYTDQLICV